MKIAIEGINGKRGTGDATLVRFVSPFGRAAGWWHGAVPDVGEERSVELSIDESDMDSAVIDAGAGPSIERLEDGRIVIRGVITSLEGAVASIAIGDALLLIDAIPSSGALQQRRRDRRCLLTDGV